MSVALPLSDTLIPRMPPELVDHIIDHLYDDKVTLAILTTICTTFLPAASLHLFHHVSINVGRKSIQDFTDFLRDGPLRIQSNVRKLTIAGIPVIADLLGRPSRDKLPIAALASLLPHMPYLSELYIRSINIEGTIALSNAIPRSLDCLSLSCVQATGGPVDICMLLILFSDIRSLHIENTTWAQLSAELAGAVHQIDIIQRTQHPCLFPSTKVTKLDTCASVYTHSFFEILRRTKTASSLERVNVICSSMLGVYSLGNFLGHAGQNVKHLVFNIARLFERQIPEVPDHVRKCLDLNPSCPALETLSLKLRLDLLNDGATAAMFSTVICLLQHAPPSLRNVVIELGLPLSISVPRRPSEARDIIRFADQEMSIEWSYLALIAESFSAYTLQFVWGTGPVHSPEIAEVLTSIVRKKIPDCKICFASSATTMF